MRTSNIFLLLMHLVAFAKCVPNMAEKQRVWDSCRRIQQCTRYSKYEEADLFMEFKSYQALREFSRDKSKSLQWDDNGEKRNLFTKVTVAVTIKDPNNRPADITLTTGCEAYDVVPAGVLCFDETLDAELNHITDLWLKHHTDVNFHILNLFTGLQSYKNIESYDIRSTVIDLVSLHHLRNFHLTVISGMTLACPFECNFDSEYLENLHITFREKKGNPQPVVSEKISFPKKIKNAYFNPIINIRGSFVFENTVFENLQIDPVPKVNMALKFKDIQVEGDLTINAFSSTKYLVESLFDSGLQRPLRFRIKFNENYRVSKVLRFRVRKTDFKEGMIDKMQCEYGVKMLTDDPDNVYEYQDSSGSKLKVRVIRRMEMKLSEVEQKWSFNKDYEETRIYVYNLVIDKELDFKRIVDFATKNPGAAGRTIVHYIQMGTLEKRLVMGMKIPFTPLKSSDIYMRYRDLKLQLLDMRQPHVADPLFQKFLAVCLTMYISPSQLGSTSVFEEPKLHRIFKVVENNAGRFDTEIYDPMAINRAMIPISFITEYVTHDIDRKLKTIPYLSTDILQNNIQILNQIGRDLRDKNKEISLMRGIDDIKTLSKTQLKQVLDKISDAKIAILKASKDKSITLADLEKQRQQDLNSTFQSNIVFLEQIKKKFDKFEALVRKETANFKRGVKIATSMAIAEAAATVVNSIFGIFSGKFDPTKAIKLARKIGKLRQVITKIMNVMRKLATLISKGKQLKTIGVKMKEIRSSAIPKLKQFFNTQKTLLKELFANDERVKRLVGKIKKVGEYTKDNVENTVNLIRATDIGWDVGDIPIDQKRKLAKRDETLSKFKNKAAEKAVEASKGYNKMDVFNWRVAKEHVTGMIDTTLSNDVPEATAYRTALLKLITTGETRSQASIDQNALEVAIAFSEKAWSKYFDEAVALGLVIDKSQDAERKEREQAEKDNTLLNLALSKRQEIDEELEWETFVLKLAFIRSNQEYCDAFYYFHLEHCKADLLIEPNQDLEKILYMQDMLLYQSNQKLQELYPPPQTFTDLTVDLTSPAHCSCLEHFKRFKTDIALSVRNAALKTTYAKIKTCLGKYGVDYPKEADKEHGFTNKVMQKCMEDPIVTLKEDNELEYKIDIDSPLFSDYERVRVDDIKLILKGATSETGVVKLYAESTGIYEDRYKGQCFKFVGSKWERALSYSQKRSQIEALPASSDGAVKVINSGRVHSRFSGVFTPPTLFTTWVFRLDSRTALDMSAMKEAHLMFSGSFVPAINKPAYTCNVNKDNGDNSGGEGDKKKVGHNDSD